MPANRPMPGEVWFSAHFGDGWPVLILHNHKKSDAITYCYITFNTYSFYISEDNEFDFTQEYHYGFTLNAGELEEQLKKLHKEDTK